MSFLDPITAAGPATELVTTGEPVSVGGAAPPNPGDVLTAVDAEHATWQPGGGGGSGGNAGGLETSGDPVDVASAAPPVAGQVLTAVDAEHAEWRVPGLHYDPSIKFWTASVGSATIASGTWGFIEQGEGATDPIVVYIVSSLEAPPVDARFGLYVGRDVTVPVSVSVLGASQIQGLDGELGPSAALLPGADYEWVFYHEDGAALWGLVSDTAAVAKYLWVDGGIVELRTSPPPNPGDVLTAVDASEAVWMAPSGGGDGGLVFASGVSPDFGEWVVAPNNTDIPLPVPDSAGLRVGVYISPGTDGVTVSCDAAVIINRINDGDTTHYLRPGGWYEWASVDFGEDFRWVPHGGQGDEARPPLEDGGGATSTPAMPNQWILAPNGGVANAPSNPQNGDSFAVYVNGASASVVAAAGHSIVSPDGTTIVASPSALALPGNTYYEWIWIDSTLQWKPKNYLDAPGNGLIRSGKTLAVGANADASIVVSADDIRVGVLATDAQHGARGGGTQHALASGSAHGFMSSANFTALAGLVSGASALITTGAAVDVSASAPPSAGKILVATDATHATWQAPASGGAQIESKIKSADGSGDNTDLTQLAFNIAIGETVFCEWFLMIDCNGGGGGPGNPTLLLNNGVSAIAVSRCNVYNQWTIGTTITPSTVVITTLQGLHTIQGIALTSGLSTCHIIATVTPTAQAIVWRPYLERHGGLSVVKAGSWGRCTRGAVIS